MWHNDPVPNIGIGIGNAVELVHTLSPGPASTLYSTLWNGLDDGVRSGPIEPRGDRTIIEFTSLQNADTEPLRTISFWWHGETGFSATVHSINIIAIPEPSTALLLGLSLFVLAHRRLRN